MENPKNIQVECSLTERQYRRYMRFHVLGDKRSVGAHLILSALIAVFGLMNFHTGSPVLGWVFVSLGVYFLVSRYLRFFISLNRITAQYGLGDRPKFFYALTFTGEGLDVQNEREQAHYPMERIQRACFMDREQMVYLYMTKDTAFLLPYAGFKEGGPDDLKARIRAANIELTTD